MEENKKMTEGTGLTEAYLKKQLFYLKIIAVAAVVTMLVIVVLGVAAVFKFQELYEQILQLVNNTNRLIISINTVGLEKVYGALGKANEIDIKALNESIEQLNKIVTPLASIFK